MKTKLFITGLAFFAMTLTGFSQNGNPQDRPGRNQGNQTEFVDENKDGVCDNYVNRTPGPGRGNGNGNGCGNCGNKQQGRGKMNGQGKGPDYIDANNDGVCDRFEAKDQQKK